MTISKKCLDRPNCKQTIFLTWWTWFWASSRSWWWTKKAGVLQSMRSQRVGDDWTTELNWTDWLLVPSYKCLFSCLPRHERAQWKIRLLCGNEGQSSPIFPFYLTRWLNSSTFSLIKMTISQLLYPLQTSVTFSPGLTLILTISLRKQNQSEINFHKLQLLHLSVDLYKHLYPDAFTSVNELGF